MGRFMSPDDGSDQSLEDPQSLNRYGYVRNNPLSNTYPDGHDCIYGDGNGGGYVQTGDCTSDKDNGIFVNGTVDANSFRYNASNNSSSFSYTPDGAGPGTIGTGTIQGPDLNGGFGAGSLGASVFGSQNASTWNNAYGAVQAATIYTMAGTAAPFGIMAGAGGGIAALGLDQFSGAEIETVVESAESPASNQISQIGRAVAKKLGHAAHSGSKSAFDGVDGDGSLIRSIMRNPSRVIRGGQTTDIYNSAGQGIRIDTATRRFIGLLEGALASR